MNEMEICIALVVTLILQVIHHAFTLAMLFIYTWRTHTKTWQQGSCLRWDSAQYYALMNCLLALPTTLLLWGMLSGYITADDTIFLQLFVLSVVPFIATAYAFAYQAMTLKRLIPLSLIAFVGLVLIVVIDSEIGTFLGIPLWEFTTLLMVLGVTIACLLGVFGTVVVSSFTEGRDILRRRRAHAS